MIIGFAIVCIIAFLVGSVPTGLIVGLIRGVDIRNHGSGNIGATNVLRTLGKRWGILVFVGDALKGWLMTTVGFGLAVSALSALHPALSVSGGWQSELLRFFIGISVVAGHVWSVFLRFDGGKGVATSVGALFGMDPFIAVIGLGFFVFVVVISRYISLGSLLGTLFAFWMSFLLGRDLGTILFTAVAFLLVLIRHRENIVRLKNGTERKFSFRKNVPKT